MSEEKRNALFTVILLAAVILIFTVADLASADRLYSPTENRLLTERPEFSAEALFSGEYTKTYEDYVTDQFVSRDKWITIKTYMDIAFGRQEIGGVYLAKDGYLIEQHLPEDYPQETVQKKLSMLAALVQDWNAKVMLVPTADNILAEKLPANAPVWDQTAFLEYAETQLGDSVFIDTASTLREHAAEDIYYRTDHHWTSLGAYYGYLAWAEAMGEVAYPYDVASMVQVSDDFLGTLHSKINISWRTDSIYYFGQTAQQPVRVTYDFSTVKSSIYEESYLDTKNQYGFFLDDNHAFVEINTGYETGKTLLVIKDSYANCFVPLLLPHYDTIYILDPRYYNARLSDLIGQYASGDVLVLYNCVHFLDDFVYDRQAGNIE